MSNLSEWITLSASIAVRITQEKLWLAFTTGRPGDCASVKKEGWTELCEEAVRDYDNTTVVGLFSRKLACGVS
jgi:hypothetical protein